MSNRSKLTKLHAALRENLATLKALPFDSGEIQRRLLMARAGLATAIEEIDLILDLPTEGIVNHVPRPLPPGGATIALEHVA